MRGGVTVLLRFEADFKGENVKKGCPERGTTADRQLVLIYLWVLSAVAVLRSKTAIRACPER